MRVSRAAADRAAAFFRVLNDLQSALPSTIPRRVPPECKGAALGVYSSAQLLGGFAGGSLGIIAVSAAGIAGAYSVAAALSAIWLIMAIGLRTAEDAGARHTQHPTT
ncbi:MAG: hypothetical protein NTZ11_10895 [Gammaproteobacteria bacterium]|nr:hypothetical protein [Gammaproteobacteria bacterium]